MGLGWDHSGRQLVEEKLRADEERKERGVARDR
jgi:hypothetical protein